MSKITPKNLQYNTDLPPFLQRLHSNNTSHDGRQEFNVARPKRARNAEEEAEDEPVYFDEATNHSMSKQEYDALVAAEEQPAEGSEAQERLENGGNTNKDVHAESDRGLEKEGRERERLAAIGGGKKRKAVKIIGSDQDAIAGDTAVAAVQGGKEALKSEGRAAERSKAGKKGKKIKLSFGDDE
jgi:hypothetical protein